MRRIHYVTLILALFAIVVFIIGTGGYSSMEAERGVNIDVVNDEKANLGISDENENTMKTNEVVLFILTNRFGAELTITAQATETNDDLNISIINTPFKLDRGASAPVAATVNCSKPRNGVPVVVHITGSNSNVRVSMNRTVRVSCTPKQEVTSTSENTVAENTSEESSDSISSVDGESVRRVTIKRENNENTTVQIITPTTTTPNTPSTTPRVPSTTATTPKSPPSTSTTPTRTPAVTAPSDTSPSTQSDPPSPIPADSPTPVPTTLPTRAPTARTPIETVTTKPTVTSTTPTPTPTSTTQTRIPTITTKPTPTLTPAPTNTLPSPSDSVPPTETNGTQTARNATITRVIDGDTFEVRFANGETDTIQLIGVDVPETVTTNETPSEYGIPNSSRGRDWLLRWNENTQMFIENNIADRQVLIVTDPISETHNNAGHLLAYVYYGDDRNTNLGRTLLERGLARQKYNTNYTVEELYRRLERNARTANRGLWAFETKTTVFIRSENTTHEQTKTTTRSPVNMRSSIPENTTNPLSTSENTTTTTPTTKNTTTTTPTTNRTLW